MEPPPRRGVGDGFCGRLRFKVTDSLLFVDGEWILELIALAPTEVELGIGDRRVGDILGAWFVGSGVLSPSKKY